MAFYHSEHIYQRRKQQQKLTSLTGYGVTLLLSIFFALKVAIFATSILKRESEEERGVLLLRRQ